MSTTTLSSPTSVVPKRPFLAAYWPVGFPDLEADLDFMDAIAPHVDLFEVGIPFSEATADGPVLQQATRQAIHSGTDFDHAVRRIHDLRQRHPHLHLTVMTYANILHSPGLDVAAQLLADAGVTGLLLPDVPSRERAPFRDIFDAAGIALIPIIAPNTPPTTLRTFHDAPMVYVAGSFGVTGGHDPGALATATVQGVGMDGDAPPVLAGFGVTTPEHVRALREAGAHGVVVGSHLVRACLDGADPDDVAVVTATLKEAV